MKLTFQGGGPMDGEHLVSEQPAETRFSVEPGGWYELWQTVPGADRNDCPTVVYEWVPGSDVISRLCARLGEARETRSRFPSRPDSRRA